ncbi:MAG: hypothetical protein CMJ89_03875 [Planctomycetes bacterium]|jgi:hypothetical protein|nr:hypothetical protein [Planctomycetota bacterium]
MKKSRIAAVALASFLFAASCIGSNKAFNSVHTWNENATESKWGREAVHVVFWVTLVYPLCLAGDIVLFNSFEFWGGENPISD